MMGAIKISTTYTFEEETVVKQNGLCWAWLQCLCNSNPEGLMGKADVISGETMPQMMCLASGTPRLPGVVASGMLDFAP